MPRNDYDSESLVLFGAPDNPKHTHSKCLGVIMVIDNKSIPSLAHIKMEWYQQRIAVGAGVSVLECPREESR